jgi:hypothetical protein
MSAAQAGMHVAVPTELAQHSQNHQLQQGVSLGHWLLGKGRMARVKGALRVELWDNVSTKDSPG